MAPWCSGYLLSRSSARRNLPEDDNDDLGALAMEEYHRAGLALRSWMRPLLFALILGAFGWFAADRIAPVVWISAASSCCLVASLTLTASSARWLTRALHDLDASYWAAVARERERWRRARSRWAGVLALAGIPLIGGAAVAFTMPTILHSLAKHPGLPALTSFAFVVGAVLCVLAWRSLFGFQRGAWTTIILVLVVLLWLLQGTGESAAVAVLMLMLAWWSYRRECRERRHLAAEWSEASHLSVGQRQRDVAFGKRADRCADPLPVPPAEPAQGLQCGRADLDPPSVRLSQPSSPPRPQTKEHQAGPAPAE